MISFGQEIYLGCIRTQDLETMRRERNSWEIRQWCRQVGLINVEDQEAWHEQILADPSIQMFSVYKGNSEDTSPLGVCGLTSLNFVSRNAEFSTYIFKNQQNKGYGKKALKTLFCHGFYNLNLHLIWGETFDGNPAALIFDKIGMVHEGIRRQFYFKNGHYLDAHLYSITVNEWDTLGYNKAIQS